MDNVSSVTSQNYTPTTLTEQDSATSPASNASDQQSADQASAVTRAGNNVFDTGSSDPNLQVRADPLPIKPDRSAQPSSESYESKAHSVAPSLSTSYPTGDGVPPPAAGPDKATSYAAHSNLETAWNDSLNKAYDQAGRDGREVSSVSVESYAGTGAFKGQHVAVTQATYTPRDAAPEPAAANASKAPGQPAAEAPAIPTGKGVPPRTTDPDKASVYVVGKDRDEVDLKAMTAVYEQSKTDGRSYSSGELSYHDGTGDYAGKLVGAAQLNYVPPSEQIPGAWGKVVSWDFLAPDASSPR